MIRNRFNRFSHPVPNTKWERDTYNSDGTKIKTAQVKRHGDRWPQMATRLSRPRSDGQGDGSACAVVNRQSFVETFTLQLSRKGTSCNFRLKMSDHCRVLRNRACWSPIWGKKQLCIYHAGGSFFAEVSLKISLL